MIRYPITLQELEARVEAHCGGWLVRASTRSEAIISTGRYDKSAAIWSEIKPVFMALQHNKCAFCERQFAAASSPGGTAELDLEHFRPKSVVSNWPGAGGFTLPMGRPHATGYYWLAYHLLNYAVACKVCNSGLKADHFPIAGRRGRVGQDPNSLHRSERPYLIYPIGGVDTDPQEVITFVGVNAEPVAADGWLRQRAEVTIAFFRLNRSAGADDFREELFRERAEVIAHLDHYLGTINSTRESKARNEEAMAGVTRMVQRHSRHSSCAKSFTDLYRRDHIQARALADAARSYLETLC